VLRTFRQSVKSDFSVKSVLAVAFSPDGRSALSGGYAGLKLWDVRSGKELRTFDAGDYEQFNSVAFSPDGLTAISGSSIHFKLWDVATGEVVRDFQNSGHVKSVAFSPDGRQALSGGDTTEFDRRVFRVLLWDVATEDVNRFFTGHENTVNSVAFSPDGRTAISGSEDNTLKLWDLTTGTLVLTPRPPRL
jgi:WD40 repeat protein